MKRLLQLLRRRKDSYTCSQCGYVFPKKGAEVSGWAGHPYGFHVHCPRCGATVAQFVKKQPNRGEAS
ncbi:MAG: hypothetical protein NWF09_08030 [Candidatus Bathyarchaeota archaeon]|nr:hypothetical protein [Candidatus Bathyarchaeota archaeon]